MSGPVLASLRGRAGSFAACALSLFFGTVLMTAFTSLIETGQADSVSEVDAETLMVMGAVIGGWGVVIVLAAVASTARSPCGSGPPSSTSSG